MAASKWRICARGCEFTYYTVNAGRSFPTVPCQLLLHPSQRTPYSLPSSGQRGGSLSRGIMVQGKEFFCGRETQTTPSSVLVAGQRNGSLSRGIMVQGKEFFYVRRPKGLLHVHCKKG
jgi:hypothetical protein